MEVVLDPRPAWRQVIYLAWPGLLQQALIFRTGIYDRFLAGNNVPPDPSQHVAYQAAQGNISYLSWFISSYTVLVSVGSTALVARFIGAQDYKLANRTVHQSVLLAVILGVLGGVAGQFAAPPVIARLGRAAAAG